MKKWLCYVTVSFVLGACQKGNVIHQNESVSAQQSVIPVVTAPAEVTRSPKAEMIARLLEQGELALRRKQYTQPSHDNALDRFKAILLLEPGNVKAQDALQTMGLVYVDRVRESLAKGRVHQANADMQIIDQSFPNLPMRAELHASLKRALSQVSEVRRKRDAPKEGEEWVNLSAADLGKRNAAALAVLSSLAKRVQVSDQSIMIFARNDAEGRWIYKTMKDAVAGYRIRGDIRISDKPAVKLMSPLQ